MFSSNMIYKVEGHSSVVERLPSVCLGLIPSPTTDNGGDEAQEKQDNTFLLVFRHKENH